MSNDRHVLQPGDPAPEFKLPAVNREGVVSLAEYRAKGSVLVALFRGLHCPFCRRQIAGLAATRERLAREGVETVAVVNTPAQRARQYFQYRPTPVVLAADPDVQTHLAFGLGETEVLPDDTDPRLLQALFSLGRAAGERWLAEHAVDVGQRGTVDIERVFLSPR